MPCASWPDACWNARAFVPARLRSPCSQATVDALHVTQCAAPNASAERLGQLQEHAGPSSANTKEIWLEQAAASEAASAPSQQRANTRLAIRELITKQV